MAAELVILDRVYELKMTCFSMQARIEQGSKQIGPHLTYVIVLLPAKQFWHHFSPDSIGMTNFNGMALFFEDPCAVGEAPHRLTASPTVA